MLTKVKVKLAPYQYFSEAFAAKEAGYQVKILLREGNAPLSNEAKSTFELIDSFDKIF